MRGTPDGGKGRGCAARGSGAARRPALGGIGGGRRTPTAAARARGRPAGRKRPCTVGRNSDGRRAPVRRVRRVRAQLAHGRHADRAIRGDGGPYPDRGQRRRRRSGRALAAGSAAGRSRRSGGAGAGDSIRARGSSGGGGPGGPGERAAGEGVSSLALARAIRTRLSEVRIMSAWLLRFAVAFTFPVFTFV